MQQLLEKLSKEDQIRLEEMLEEHRNWCLDNFFPYFPEDIIRLFRKAL